MSEYHGDGSFETLGEVPAFLLMTMSFSNADSPRTERVTWREQAMPLCWFYTLAHATTDQSAQIAPDSRHAAGGTDKRAGMRGERRMTDNRLMGKGGCNGL